jgi:hypothetical protein
MPRPPAQPKRSEIRPDELEFFDAAVGRYLHGYMPGAKPEDDNPLPTALAAELNSPRYAAAIAQMGTVSRTAGEREGGMQHIDREWVDQVVSYHYGYVDMLTVHTPDAIATGVRIEAIEALRDGREEEFTEREKLVTAYIRGIITRSLTDEVYDAIEADMGRRGAVELMVFTCYFQFLLHLFMAIGGPAAGSDVIDGIIEDIKSGKRELPDWRAHMR